MNINQSSCVTAVESITFLYGFGSFYVSTFSFHFGGTFFICFLFLLFEQMFLELKQERNNN
jgi:hypothetical protein